MFVFGVLFFSLQEGGKVFGDIFYVCLDLPLMNGYLALDYRQYFGLLMTSLV